MHSRQNPCTSLLNFFQRCRQNKSYLTDPNKLTPNEFLKALDSNLISRCDHLPLLVDVLRIKVEILSASLLSRLYVENRLLISSKTRKEIMWANINYSAPKELVNTEQELAKVREALTAIKSSQQITPEQKAVLEKYSANTFSGKPGASSRTVLLIGRILQLGNQLELRGVAYSK